MFQATSALSPNLWLLVWHFRVWIVEHRLIRRQGEREAHKKYYIQFLDSIYNRDCVKKVVGFCGEVGLNRTKISYQTIYLSFKVCTNKNNSKTIKALSFHFRHINLSFNNIRGNNKIIFKKCLPCIVFASQPINECSAFTFYLWKF